MIRSNFIFLTAFFLGGVVYAQVSGGLPPLRTTVPSVAPAPTLTPTLAPTPDKLVQATQELLNQKGFNVGLADGFMGPQTQAAISSAQSILGLTITGAPTDSLLAAIKSGLSGPATQSNLKSGVIKREVIGAVRSVYRDLQYAEVLISGNKTVSIGQTLFIGSAGHEVKVSRIFANLVSVVSKSGAILAPINTGETVATEIK